MTSQSGRRRIAIFSVGVTPEKCVNLAIRPERAGRIQILLVSVVAIVAIGSVR